LVWEVVRRTRLWSTEKVAVARELIAHFQDGLAAGTNVEDLSASFGDLAQAAALIRRAKRRNRPLIWKAAKFTAHMVAWPAALALLLYTIQAVRLYSHAPNIARNYVAEWNQDALTVPPAERAWPVYVAAMQAMNGDWEHSWYGEELSPGSAAWPAMAEVARSNSRALELYRQASSMPKLGIALGNGPDVDYMVNDAGQPIVTAGATPDSNPAFFSILLPPLQNFRSAASLLTVDALLAAEPANAERAHSDLEAIFGIVGHVRQARLLIADFVAAAIASHACRTVGMLLHDHPQLFDDNELTQIAHRLAGLGDLRVRFASERATVEDYLQRYFTDDGHGDGLGRPELLVRLSVFPGDRVAPTDWTAISPFMAGRREMHAKFLDYIARYEAEAATPLWQRDPSSVDAELERLRTSPRQWVRYAPVVIFMPLLTRVGPFSEYFAQRRDATLVALALELYHRQHGSWPQSLDELVPQLLPQVPPDRYDGKPIKYRVLDGQPLLYSVGVDRKDDGGRLPAPETATEKTTPAQLNRLAREWQPQPAPHAQPVAGSQKSPADGDWILWPPVE
jgi:hypothetical protein